MVSVVLVLSYARPGYSKESYYTYKIKHTLEAPEPIFILARPPAAFVRIRACWYASAAISDTNFWAARARSRFLRNYLRVYSFRFFMICLQPCIITFESYSLKVVICDFRWNLTSNGIVLVARVQICTYQRFIFIKHK